jgi:hypothetical protein
MKNANLKQLLILFWNGAPFIGIADRADAFTLAAETVYSFHFYVNTCTRS